MFADVKVKDYTIELDGKPHTIKNERWLGIVARKDGLVTDEDNYFEGSVFDWNEETQSYSMGGSVEKTLKEFEAEVERATFFK